MQTALVSPAPAPRNRSLITVSALIAAGQSAQITFHLNWLCSDAPSYVTGQSISVDGGFTMR